ncbi:hypothetical protein [Streptomyces sp. 2A115]|uniref:hypothetical protein n=1 Tax=Streptomyces sp. 2A115 TaxID=3457439 RepID=UPI003FCFEEA9
MLTIRRAAAIGWRSALSRSARASTATFAPPATRHLIIEALDRALRGESVIHGEEGPRGDGLEALYITGHSLGGAMAALMGVGHGPGRYVNALAPPVC